MTTIFKFVIAVVTISGHFAKDLAENKVYYDLDDAEKVFANYIVKFNKQYSDKEEYARRLEIFKKELKSLNELNAQYPNTIFGINNFSDLTYEEFERTYTGLQLDFSEGRTDYVPVGNAPDALDYRKDGYVTEVKDQRNCGACYAFSAIGAVEGAYAMKNKKLFSLSEQQVLDCGKGDCVAGGQMGNVMQELARQGGSVQESDYPYTEVKGTCTTDSSKIVVKVTGGEVMTVSEDALKDALANFGPLAIGLRVNDNLRKYTGGVFTANCTGKNGHALVLVGYGHDGEDYWIIKNSWNKSWGEEGYIRMARGKGMCDIGIYVARAFLE